MMRANPDQAAAISESFRQTLTKVGLGHVSSAAQAADMGNALLGSMGDNGLVNAYTQGNKLTFASTSRKPSTT